MPATDIGSNEKTHDDTIERTSIVMYAILERLHEALASPKAPDDISLGMLMGMTMFLDDKMGPFRAERLMNAAPSIILKTDAHVVREQVERMMPVIRAFGDQLAHVGGDDPGTLYVD